MKLRWFILLVIILPLAMTACATKSTLRFENHTDCGTATIQFTNASNGGTTEYRVAQGDSVEIEIQKDTTYNYHLQYEGNCEPKDATVQVSQTGTTTIDLRSATATPNIPTAPDATTEPTEAAE